MEIFNLSTSTLGTLLIICAVISDVIANIFLKKSQGFKQKIYGLIAISLVGIAFLFLASAIKLMDLSIAYSLFGAFGLLITTTIDKLFFGLTIRPIGILGLFIMIGGIILVKTV